MTRTASVDVTLPEESEVRAAVQGQRELAVGTGPGEHSPPDRSEYVQKMLE